MSAVRQSTAAAESGRPLSRRAVLGAAIAAAAGLTAACGSNSSSGGGGASSFTYWSMWKQNEPQAKVLQAAIAQFTKDTGIKVSVQWKGRQVVQQLAPTLNTGNVPADLVDSADRFAYAQLQATGQALDLTPVLDLPIPGESGHTVGSVVPAKYHGLSTTAGTLWQIPYEIITTQIWYDGHALPDVAARPPPPGRSSANCWPPASPRAAAAPSPSTPTSPTTPPTGRTTPSCAAWAPAPSARPPPTRAARC